jgi:hypothetical protein
MGGIQRALALLAVGASTAGASVDEPVSATALVEACRGLGRDPVSPDNFCDGYLRGFLAAIRSEGLLGANAAAGPETFVARAARTRLWLPQEAPKYCIADGIGIERVAERFIEYAQARDTEGVAAEHLLRQMLRSEYACTD